MLREGEKTGEHNFDNIFNSQQNLSFQRTINLKIIGKMFKIFYTKSLKPGVYFTLNSPS